MLVQIKGICCGHSHSKDGKPCQDFCETFADNYIGLAIVADGHGGDKYIRSDVGSYEAVFRSKIFTHKMAKGDFETFIKKKDKKAIESNLELLKGHIIREWREIVKNHYALHELSEKERSLCEDAKIALPVEENEIPTLYGTTLLVCGYIEKYHFWFALQIGDGKTVLIREDNSVFSPPELENEKLGFGVTTSLCSQNAGNEFRHAFGFEKLNGIAVMSDGLTDSFEKEKLPDFILNIKHNAISDVEKTKAELQGFLPRLSEQGSGDDISIAGIFVKDEENKMKNALNSVLAKKDQGEK